MNTRKYMAYFWIILIVLSFPVSTFASEPSGDGWTPIQLSIWHPAQLFSEKKDVYGLRVNLFYGENESIRGLDLGVFVNNTQQGIKGIQASGLMNINRGPMTGIQIAGFGNGNKSMRGIQIAGMLNHVSNHVYGVQVALLENKGTIHGLQIGALNNFSFVELRKSENSKISYNNDVIGVQIGWMNHGKKVTGLQIGFMNSADELHGVQIGIINFVKHSFGFPIINIKF